MPKELAWDNLLEYEVVCMTDESQDALSERLQQISAELRSFDLALKSGATPELVLLQEFRQILDGARMTAWTVSELLNAAESRKDAARVLSFLAAERLRRSNQMLRDLCADIEDQGVTWQTSGVQRLFETVNVLQLQLRQLLQKQHRQFDLIR